MLTFCFLLGLYEGPVGSSHKTLNLCDIAVAEAISEAKSEAISEAISEDKSEAISEAKSEAISEAILEAISCIHRLTRFPEAGNGGDPNITIVLGGMWIQEIVSEI